MPSWSSTFGGSAGGQYRLTVVATLLYQQAQNNRSRVRLDVYVDKLTGSGYWNFNSIDNNAYFNGSTINADWGSGYDFRNYTRKYIVKDYDGWVYHNGDGTKTANFSAYSNMANSPYITTASAGGNYTLPNLASEPDVSTSSALSVQPNQATLGGNVTDANYASITQRGIYYSTSDSTPDSNDLKKTVSGTTGSFSTTLTGLSANTKYYYRAYAINSQGTGYGAVKSFTTPVTPFAYLTYDNTEPYADGKMMRDTGSGWTDVTGDLYFETRSEQGATTVPQNSVEPGQMIKNVLDFHNENGGSIIYSGSSISDTATTVTYEFVSQTCYEAINTILGLAPYNWYWYIDSATNTLYFKEKSSTADHMLTLGKDIESMHVDKRTDDIVNTVYFTGGDTGGGAILYKKYQDADSIGLYGVRETKYIDQRVTNASTAETIATKILNEKANPEIRLEIVVADSNSLTGAYDIESIKIGDTIQVKNVKSDTEAPTLDINTTVLQVVRRRYTPTGVHLTCSTVPPDVSKRIEDINRNLESSQTINNPDTPS